MRRMIARAAVAAVLTVSAGAAHAETGPKSRDMRDSVVRTESTARGLKSLFGAIRGKGLLRKRAEPVSFTRDWLDAQPMPRGDENWACLTEALYFEARGETVRGQFAVAEVIMNRVRSGQFPNSPCAVIHQGTGKRYQCQFTYTCDGHEEAIAEPQAYERVAKVARAIIDGAAADLTGGATHYHNTAVRPRWAKTFTETARIGVHIFYRPKYRTASSG